MSPKNFGLAPPLAARGLLLQDDFNNRFGKISKTQYGAQNGPAIFILCKRHETITSRKKESGANGRQRQRKHRVRSGPDVTSFTIGIVHDWVVWWTLRSIDLRVNQTNVDQHCPTVAKTCHVKVRQHVAGTCCPVVKPPRFNGTILRNAHLSNCIFCVKPRIRWNCIAS